MGGGTTSSLRISRGCRYGGLVLRGPSTHGSKVSSVAAIEELGKGTLDHRRTCHMPIPHDERIAGKGIHMPTAYSRLQCVSVVGPRIHRRSIEGPKKPSPPLHPLVLSDDRLRSWSKRSCRGPTSAQARS